MPNVKFRTVSGPIFKWYKNTGLEIKWWPITWCLPFKIRTIQCSVFRCSEFWVSANQMFTVFLFFQGQNLKAMRSISCAYKKGSESERRIQIAELDKFSLLTLLNWQYLAGRNSAYRFYYNSVLWIRSSDSAIQKVY